MAELGEENKVQGVFGGVEFGGKIEEQAGGYEGFVEIEGLEGTQPEQAGESTVFKKVEPNNLPAKQTVWSKVKGFLFQEIDLMAPIKVELTPYQQKVEDEINAFLHQEISFKGFFNLFKKNK
ncbi:MAG: hypothetical protein HFJ17_06130 [Clostridia bacterium]|nr:hypothetical protein [Clostridia bacterium]